MCGICFSVKQSFVWRKQTRQTRQRRGDFSAAPPQAAAATQVPESLLSALEERGIIELFSLTPCPVALSALLRVVNLQGCRRQYVPPAPQLLSSVPGSTLFMRILENTRRRGPETFGATRRVLDEECVLSITGGVLHSGDETGAKKDGNSGRASSRPSSKRVSGHDADDEDQRQQLFMRTELQGISAVLGLRGHATVHQPFEMEVETDLEEEDERVTTPVNKSFLQWNGEIFNGPMCPPPWGSDTVVLASRLSQLEQECVPTSETDPMNHLSLRARQELFLARCVQVFEEEVQGPYGFLFYANQLQLAVFGRDPLGRHSLLAHLSIYDYSDTAVNSGTAVAAAAAKTASGIPSSAAVLEVELIVSSVGIQHATHFSGDEAGVPASSSAAGKTASEATQTASSGELATADGDRKRPRPAGSAGSPSAPNALDVDPSGPSRRAPREEGDDDTNIKSTHTTREQTEGTSAEGGPVPAAGTTPATAGSATAKPTRQPGKGKEGNETEASAAAAAAAATAAAASGTRANAKDKDEEATRAGATTKGGAADDAHHTGSCEEPALEEDESLQGCWVELPVSGLFAVPLDRPLVADEVLLAAAAAAVSDGYSTVLRPSELTSGAGQCPKDSAEAVVAPHAHSDDGARRTDDNVCASCTAAGAHTAPREECHHHVLLLNDAGVKTAKARGLLLHCPWRDRYHLVHPLLRAFVAIAEQEKQQRQQEMDRAAGKARNALIGQQPGSPHDKGGSSAIAPSAALPFGLPSTWTPPQRPLLFSDDDTVPALPPLLAERLSHFAPAAGASEDATWAHWAATCYLHALSAAVMRRTDVASAGAEDSRDWATFSKALRRPLCVLFSGGIDCTVLAALAHHILPLETPIELVNVSFGAAPEQAPDRVAALRAMEELLKLPQPEPHPDSLAAAANQGTMAATEREWRLVLVDVPDKLSGETNHILDLVTPRHTVMDLDIGTALWYAARGVGRMQVLRHSDIVAPSGEQGTGLTYHHHSMAGSHPTARDGCHARSRSPGAVPGLNTPKSSATQGGGSSNELGDLLYGFNKHVRVASTPLAPSTNPQSVHAATDEESKFGLLIEVMITEARQGDGPSRPVLLSTLGKEYGPLLQPHIAAHGYKKMGAFLNDACKAGLIRFDSTAASKAVVLGREEDRARAVPPPPCRWFPTPWMKQQQQRAGGEAGLTPPPGTFDLNYTSKAKVLLVGMGADETLGGYTRYRRFFARQGMQGTRQELEKDFARLWMRNLGRDDRITMDSGREPRFPYLDEELLLTLEKIVTERRKSLLSNNPLNSDSRFSQVLQRKAAAAAEAEAATAPTDEDVEAALLQTSLEPIMSFRLGPGEGDKRVLRNVAEIIGLDTVTRLQKRAIQFGTRIADRRVRGTAEL